MLETDLDLRKRDGDAGSTLARICPGVSLTSISRPMVWRGHLAALAVPARARDEVAVVALVKSTASTRYV